MIYLRLAVLIMPLIFLIYFIVIVIAQCSDSNRFSVDKIEALPVGSAIKNYLKSVKEEEWLITNGPILGMENRVKIDKSHLNKGPL